MAKTDTGFIDPGNKGFAVRKLKRGQDGRIYVIFVDAKTGQEVKDPTNYNIIQQSHQVDTTSETPQKEGIEKDDKSITDELIRRDGDSGDSASENAAKDFNREMSDNYGYQRAPAGLGLVGFMGGPVGMAAKMAGLGFKANNEGAVQSARETLGLKERGLFDSVKSMMTNRDGYIGDVTYNDKVESTPIGFEASDKYGRTTLTPNEARMRQQLAGNFQEATPEIMKQSVNSFRQENPNARQGLLSGLFSGARNIFNSLLNEDINTNANSKSYPHAPSLEAEQVTQNSRTQTNSRESEAYRDSKQARDAIDSGSKGLW